MTCLALHAARFGSLSLPAVRVSCQCSAQQWKDSTTASPLPIRRHDTCCKVLEYQNTQTRAMANRAFILQTKRCSGKRVDRCSLRIFVLSVPHCDFPSPWMLEPLRTSALFSNGRRRNIDVSLLKADGGSLVNVRWMALRCQCN